MLSYSAAFVPCLLSARGSSRGVSARTIPHCPRCHHDLAPCVEGRALLAKTPRFSCPLREEISTVGSAEGVWVWEHFPRVPLWHSRHKCYAQMGRAQATAVPRAGCQSLGKGSSFAVQSCCSQGSKLPQFYWSQMPVHANPPGSLPPN